MICCTQWHGGTPASDGAGLGLANAAWMMVG
jgi:hypothetical protein